MNSLRVEKAMTADPITVSAETSVTDVARIMVDNNIGGVPVIGESGEVLGIVTESDLIVHDSDV